MQETLGWTPDNTQIGHGNKFLQSSAGEVEAEDQKFKAILSYVESLRLAWVTGYPL